jgi:hypothetical protein
VQCSHIVSPNPCTPNPSLSEILIVPPPPILLKARNLLSKSPKLKVWSKKGKSIVKTLARCLMLENRAPVMKVVKVAVELTG